LYDNIVIVSNSIDVFSGCNNNGCNGNDGNGNSNYDAAAAGAAAASIIMRCT